MAARLTTYVVVAIVAATLIAGLIVGAQRDDSDGPVDLIVFHGKVYSADAAGGTAEAVAIRGNQILRVGSDRDVARLQRPQTVMVDARGGAIVPGFNDAEVRFIDGGLRLEEVDLSGAESQDEVVARVAEWAEAHPDRPWVVGRGWSGEMFGKGGPTRQLLDGVTGTRPACILSADGNAAWVNSAALRRAGVTRRTTTPAGGSIEKDGRGEPNGVLRRAAAAAVTRLIPAPTRDDRALGLRAAIAEAHEHGVTSVQDASVAGEDFALYDEARRAGALDLRVYASIAVGAGATERDFTSLDTLSRRFPDDPLFKVGGAHIAVDGPAGQSAVALLEADPDPVDDTPAPPTTIQADELNRLVRLLDARGWQITIDAFGDLAARMALDAYEHAAMSNPEPARGRRHRIGRLMLVSAEDLPKFGPLGIIAVVRPDEAAAASVEAVEKLTPLIGEARAARAWPAATITPARTRVAFATGWPDGALHPLDAIAASATRGAPDGFPIARAIDAFTAAPAYASFDEQRKGALKPGMLADLVVLSSNVLDGNPDRLSTAAVVLTVFDGRIVYRRAAASTN
ncbi:MAG: amidohydrolase [Acidobacteriota bacterium]